MKNQQQQKPGRILMTADTVGGVWTYALELTRALAAHNIEIWLATMGAPLSPSQRDEAAALPGLKICESRFKLEWMEDPWNDVRLAGEWLLQLASYLKPDVVHLNGYAHGALHWPAPVLVVGHSCVASWWRAVKGTEAPAAWNRYRQAVARGLTAADLVIAPTQAMLDALNEHYGPLPASRVIYNGRALPPAPARASKENLIFTAGRLWDEAKNIAAVERVAAHLSWPVCAAGDDWHPSSGARPALGKLRQLGRLPFPVVARWLERASIYALPARYEPFGLSALEAALSGCALVLGDIPSLREVWGGAALFVPANDTEALRYALERLIADPELRRDYAAGAQLRAMRYSPRQMAAGYLAAYSELITRHIATGENPRMKKEAA